VSPGAAGSPGAGVVVGGGGTASTGHDPATDVNDGGGGASGGSVVSAPACSEQPMSPQPAEGTAWWDGHSAVEGSVVQWVCNGGLTAATCTYCTVLTPHFVANGAAAGGGAPPPPPPPTPEQLAQQAYQLLSMPDPSMNFGPDPYRIAVRYWLYLWVNDPGVVSATVTAGAVSVTATAKMTSVTWTMGEPVSADNLASRSAPITCQGTGTNPGPSVDTTAQPAAGSCAYMFQVRSTPERTGGSGTWPVTATANWTITWAANTGQAGTLAAPPRVSIGQAGFTTPDNSGGQRAAGAPVAWEQGQPGDIVGFPGHVAIYLGTIDGTRYILEASWVGTPIHVVPITRTDFDPELHRYWS